MHGVGLWKVIRKDRDLLSYRVAFFVGNGKRVRFWKDKWCGDELLCIFLTFLFAIVSSKEAWVEEVWNHSPKGGCWASHFSR